MNGGFEKPPSSSSSSSSSLFLNRLCSSMTLIALGAIGGFGIFHSALQHRIQQTEQNHNVTLSIVAGKFAESEKERSLCVDTDDGRLQEISDLRGRLDAQYKSWYDLTAMQRSVVSKHEESKAELEAFRVRYGEDQNAIGSMQSELERTNRNLSEFQEKIFSHQQTQTELETELLRSSEESRKTMARIEEKERELDAVQKNAMSLNQERSQLEQRSNELQEIIRQRDEELELAGRHSRTLTDEKTQMEKDIDWMAETLARFEINIREKDEEILKYQKEEQNIETKLVNFREGMVKLLKEKIVEIQNLEEKIEELQEEKSELEVKLDNWREGMLSLVREKMEEIEKLKADLANLRKNVEEMTKNIEIAHDDQATAEAYIKDKLDVIDRSDPEKEAVIRELTEEIERIRGDLEVSHEWTTGASTEIEYLRTDATKAETEIQEKTSEIDELKRQIDDEQERAKGVVAQFESQLVNTRRSVEEKTMQIESLKTELSEFVMEIKSLKSALGGVSEEDNDNAATATTSEMMIDHIQQRDGVVCRQLFGKGPYYVKFVIRLPANGDSDGDELFFVIELSKRKQLPHSTYNFITLVESNLYNDGSAFLSAQGDGFQIGSSSSPEVPSLEQKLKPLGLTGGSSLSFVETTEAPTCGEFSVAFVHRGPGLNVFLSDRNIYDDTECFAQVIRGHDNLRNIRSFLARNDAPLEIVSAQHLRVD